MICLGVKNITKMLMKKKIRASKADQIQRMKEVKAFAEKRPSAKLNLTENWFEADERQNEEEEDSSQEDDKSAPLLADKESVFQQMIEESKGAVSRQMLEKIYAQMEKERLKDK